MLGIGLSLTGRLRSSVFSPASLFRANEPGIFLDPSSLETLFQDAAGTTPVTAPGQPVGLALDKSQGQVLGPELVTNGDFATATNTSGWEHRSNANVVVTPSQLSLVGGRLRVPNPTSSPHHAYQLLTLVPGRTYLFVSKGRFIGTDGAAGARIKYGNTVGSADPVAVQFYGFTNAGEEVSAFTATRADAHVSLYSGFGTINTHVEFAGVSLREIPRFYATASGTSRPTYGVVPSRGRVNILNATATLATQTRPVTAAQHTLSFRGTGTVTLTGASTAGPLVGTGANDIVSLTFTPTAGNLTLTVSGTVNDAQLELGAARGTYQLVSDAGGFNITDPVGFPTYPCHYLSFDGIDDFMQTPTITPGADKVQVFAGVRKLSDAATGIVAELSAAPADLGAFTVSAPNPTLANSFGFFSRGSLLPATAAVASFPAPTTRVYSGLGDISGDTGILRIDGTQAAQGTGDQGTGNYLAYPLFIGRRGGTSLSFNGQLFSLIVRFSTTNLDAGLISQTERWMGQKTGVTIA